MIAFKFRVNQIAECFSCNCVVVLFFPYSNIAAFGPVFPHTVWPTAHPFYAGAFIFRIIE
jgi:hypothetical protein